jgi:hypothetical protein
LGQLALQQTSAKKHARNRMNEHCYPFSLLAAKNSKDEKKQIYFLRMKTDYPPFGGQRTKQYLKCYSS